MAKREKARHRGDKRHRRGILSVGSASWPPSPSPSPPAFNGHSLARDRCTVKTENIFPTRGGGGEDRGWTGSAFDRRAISAPKGFRRESVFFRKSQGLTIPLLLGNSVFPRLRVFLLGVVHRRRSSLLVPLGLDYTHVRSLFSRLSRINRRFSNVDG